MDTGYLGPRDSASNQYMEVKFRKCVIETSVKGIFFYHLEFWSMRRIRKTAEKMEKLVALSDQIWDFIKVITHYYNTLGTIYFRG